MAMPILEAYESSLPFTIKSAPHPVLLAVVSEGCPHCVNMKPHLAALSEQYRGKVQTWALVAERAPSGGLPWAFEGFPTLLGFQGGQPIWRQVGAPDPARLAQMFEDLAGRSGPSKGFTVPERW